MIGTELTDILFGTPTPTQTESNLGVLEEDMVNGKNVTNYLSHFFCVF